MVLDRCPCLLSEHSGTFLTRNFQLPVTISHLNDVCQKVFLPWYIELLLGMIILHPKNLKPPLLAFRPTPRYYWIENKWCCQLSVMQLDICNFCLLFHYIELLSYSWENLIICFQGLREFLNEVNTLASLQHPNLCKLIGFHARDGSEQRMLVYERLYHGSLDRLLYGRSDGPTVDWNARMKVAFCAAQGLTFLHEEGPFQVLRTS